MPRPVDLESHRVLQVLEAIAEDRRITQRGLSAKAGMALGLANLYLRRLVRKGYVTCVNVRSNRLVYLLTPTGLAEKTRLTYGFLQHSAVVLRQGREHFRTMLRAADVGPGTRVALYGTDEAAELAYLCLRELGVHVVAVVDDQGPSDFLGFPVTGIEGHEGLDYELMILASFSDPAATLSRLQRLALPADKLVLLCPQL